MRSTGAHRDADIAPITVDGWSGAHRPSPRSTVAAHSVICQTRRPNHRTTMRRNFGRCVGSVRYDLVTKAMKPRPQVHIWRRSS